MEIGLTGVYGVGVTSHVEKEDTCGEERAQIRHLHSRVWIAREVMRTTSPAGDCLCVQVSKNFEKLYFSVLTTCTYMYYGCSSLVEDCLCIRVRDSEMIAV